MHLYITTIFFFLFVNYLITTLVKKYTYEKFFIYVVAYFILANLINLIYLESVNFFTFQALFSVTILFLYAGLHRSVSVKIMIYLYSKRGNINANKFYKFQFKEKSFNKRVKILVNNGFIIKKNKFFFLSPKGKKYLKIFKIGQSIYKIKSSG